MDAFSMDAKFGRPDLPDAFAASRTAGRCSVPVQTTRPVAAADPVGVAMSSEGERRTAISGVVADPATWPAARRKAITPKTTRRQQ